jgi:hypothetical protein
MQKRTDASFETGTGGKTRASSDKSNPSVMRVLQEVQNFNHVLGKKPKIPSMQADEQIEQGNYSPQNNEQIVSLEENAPSYFPLSFNCL